MRFVNEKTVPEIGLRVIGWENDWFQIVYIGGTENDGQPGKILCRPKTKDGKPMAYDVKRGHLDFQFLDDRRISVAEGLALLRTVGIAAATNAELEKVLRAERKERGIYFYPEEASARDGSGGDFFFDDADDYCLPLNDWTGILEECINSSVLLEENSFGDEPGSPVFLTVKSPHCHVYELYHDHPFGSLLSGNGESGFADFSVSMEDGKATLRPVRSLFSSKSRLRGQHPDEETADPGSRIEQAFAIASSAAAACHMIHRIRSYAEEKFAIRFPEHQSLPSEEQARKAVEEFKQLLQPFTPS